MSNAEELKDIEDEPHAWVPRVIKGGKEPPSERGCWLEHLPDYTVFLAAAAGWQARKFTLICKLDKFYLLEEDDCGYEVTRYVLPKTFCNHHPDYEVLGIETPPQEGEDNEHSNRPV